MPEMPDVVATEPVESAWGNDIRDRTVQRYADFATLNGSHPLPGLGDLAFLDDSQALLQWNGTTWGARVFFADGVVTNPAMAFLDDTTSGWWRRAGEVLLSVLGVQKLSATPDRFLFGAGHAGQASVRATAAVPDPAFPEYGFHLDEGTGMRRTGAGTVALVAAGADVAIFATGNRARFPQSATWTTPTAPNAVVAPDGGLEVSTAVLVTKAEVDDLRALVVALQLQVDAL